MKFISAILTNLIASVVISTFLFLAAFSIITGEFPPKAAKIKNSIAAIKNLSTQLKLNQSTEVGSDPNESGVNSVVEMHKQRQDVMAQIIQDTQAIEKTTSDIEKRMEANERRISILQSKMEALIIEIQILRDQTAKASAKR